MKLILAIADADHLTPLLGELSHQDAPGYTVFPILAGAGRTGLHSGNRVHPGSLAAVVVVAEDSAAQSLFTALVAHREAARDTVTRFFLLPVERQA